MIRKYKFQSLESLRAYMAWWVVAGHGLHLAGFYKIDDIAEALGTGGGNQVITQIGLFLMRVYSAVNVFIILSGFVITHLLLSKKEPYLHYITRRFFRLAPALYVCLLLGILWQGYYATAYTTFPFSGNTAMRLSRLAEQQDHFFTHLFAHLTLFHSLLPQELLPFSATTFVAPAWSIGLEWQFYLIAPVLVLVIKRAKDSIYLIAFLMLAARFFVNHQDVLDWQYNSFFFQVPDYFMVGILSRLVIDRLRNNKQAMELLLIIPLLLMRQDPYSSFIWLAFLGIIFIETGFIEVNSKFIKHTLNFFIYNKVIGAIGRWSYSTYLIHVPIFALLVGSYADYVSIESVTQQDVLIIFLISMPIILVLSALMYRFVELPPINYVKNFLRAK